MTWPLIFALLPIAAALWVFVVNRPDGRDDDAYERDRAWWNALTSEEREAERAWDAICAGRTEAA